MQLYKHPHSVPHFIGYRKKIQRFKCLNVMTQKKLKNGRDFVLFWGKFLGWDHDTACDIKDKMIMTCDRVVN